MSLLDLSLLGDFSLPPREREPDELTLEAMQMYLETGCVPAEWLERETGGVGTVVVGNSNGYRLELNYRED